ncbi:MAG TPA: hypothetical protein ENN43_02640, partial [bacterium]|nr:hypothetical protein [bacterium]
MMKFAVDIGTRKVAGIIGELVSGKIRIIDAETAEHGKRAMLDGQIHSIEDVTKTVNIIKHALEQRNNIRLTKVTTALAGRSLFTEEACAEAQKKGEITGEDAAALELEAVKKAFNSFSAKKGDDYNCVGYSPVYYKIDGEIMKSIVGQRSGKSIETKVIATFLPRSVFDSMHKVLKNCGLELENITLEPIAALQVTIPEDMRLLNLVLVDVGAGTSDIAVTEKGRITAYGMIPKAGDEITEEMCSKYLVDFSSAERIKRNIDTHIGIESKDIFNNPFYVSYADYTETVSEKAGEIARDIADLILTLNTKPPQAVIMAGGGSNLEILRHKLAESLGLPKSRVGSRVPEGIINFDKLPEMLRANEGITPVGILETALFGRGLGFIEITINGEKHNIINFSQEIRVIDALTASGLKMKLFYGRPGDAITATVNGEVKIIRGGRAEHAKVFINNEEKTLYDAVKKGDSIYMSPAKDGESARASVKDILPAGAVITVSVNEKQMEISPLILVNGKESGPDEPLADRDEISVESRDSARDILEKLGYSADTRDERDIIVTLNGEPVVLKQRNYRLKVNGAEASLDYRVKNMDKIEFK